MAILRQFDSRSGITYAYDAVYRWDTEKKQSRCKRTLIGRVDPETGEIFPTDGRMKKRRERLAALAAHAAVSSSTVVSPEVAAPGACASESEQFSAASASSASAVTQCSEIVPAIPDRNPLSHRRLFCGATHLLDCIGEKLGLIDDLRACFPTFFEQILSIIYYLILEDKNPLYRFEKWGLLHRHPYGENISSQYSSEIFMNITEDAIQKFFQLQGRRRMEDEHWVYDTTSISSYSKTLKQVQYGHNKEDDKLPQINLALVFGEKSRLPFYYRKLAGNIPDVKTVKILQEDLETLNLSGLKMIMDRGFFSIENINNMLKEGLNFLISASKSLKFVQKAIDKIWEPIQSFECHDEHYKVYSVTVPTEWDGAQKCEQKESKLSEKHTIYTHVFYSIDKMAEDRKNMDRNLAQLKDELKSGKHNPENNAQYKKYFKVTTTPENEVQVSAIEENIRKARRYFGFFTLITDQKMESMEALKLYKNKDVIEKAFGNLKERLNMRRTLVSSEESLTGKIFVEFVALIYMSYLNKQMQDKGLYKDYTMATMLDKLDVIECVEKTGGGIQVGEILKKQKDIYEKLGCIPPTSSCV